MTAPRVAIGLPVYNGARYVGEAIDSVLAQTYSDFELVISDNASSDATEEVCRDYAARDSRVRYHRAAENRGAAWNFNRTFELSDSEYFKWLAHDDVIGPRYLEHAIAVLERDPAVVLCHSRTGIIDGRGELVGDDGSQDFETWDLQGVTADDEFKRLVKQRSAKPHERYLGVLLYSIRNHEVFGLIRRVPMRQAGLHRAYRGGEKVFLADLSLLGAFHEVPELLSFSRWHDERFSSNGSAQAQNLHVQGKAARKMRFPRQFRATWGYCEAAVRHELSLKECAACFLVLARFLLQTRKWQAVVREYLAGAGQLAKLPDNQSGSRRSTINRHWTTWNVPSAMPEVRQRTTV